MKQKRVTWRHCLLLAVLLTLSLNALGEEIINPSMEGEFIENIAEYWECLCAGGSGMFSEGTEAHEGVKSQGIGWYGYGGMSFGPDGIYQQISSLEPGRTYCISAWFKYTFWPQGSWGDSSVTFSVDDDEDYTLELPRVDLPGML